MTSRNARSRVASEFTVKLLCGTALAVLAGSAAYAQNETVTVTGTSIRGTAPVGANIISVDRTTIDETAAVTTQELLTNIPQITGASGGFGSSGQGSEGGGGAISSPNIHSLGTQASTATLTLIDGHVFSPVGQTTNVIDPSIIPTAALQRVEVLPDGASAIYGANAVAGVINFITRRDYNGYETRVQAGTADHYSTFSASQLFGHTWEGGSVMAVYSYSSRSNLYAKWRDYMNPRQDILMGPMTPEQAAQFTGLPSGLPAGAVATTPAASDATAGSVFPGTAVPFPSLGSNFQNFNCPVAAISTNQNGNAWLYPYNSGAGTINGTAGFSRSINQPSQGVCDQRDYSTALVATLNNNAMVAIRQQLTDRISVHVDLVRGTNITSGRSSRGTLSGTAFRGDTVAGVVQGTGGPAFGTGQRNPFYVPVPGTTGAAANSQFITVDLNQILGGKAWNKANTTNQFATLGLDADLGGNWAFTLGSTFGSSATASYSNGSVVGAQGLLALNGTTISAGTASNTPATSALGDPYGLGTVVSVTRALTTANALDVWRPAATNRTSEAVKRSMVDNGTYSVVYNNLVDVVAKFDGPLYDLWGAGETKVAFGANYNQLNQPQYLTANNGAGPGSTSSRGRQFFPKRTSYATFAEFLIPIVSPDFGIPFVQSFLLNMSGRYDKFSDFGETLNPKVSATWNVVDGLSARGSFGTSFVAPNVHDVGGPGGVNSQTAVSTGASLNNKIYPFLSVAPLPFSQGPFGALRGAGTAGTIVETAATCIAINSAVGATGTAAARLVDINGTPLATALQVGTTTMGTGANQAYGCQLTSGNITGLQISGGNADIKPQRGLTYSAGLDIDAGQIWDVLDGLNVSVTYYDTKFMDVITNQQVTTNIPEATSLAPASNGGAAGWTLTDAVIQDLIGSRPITGTLPQGRIYTIIDTRIQNPYVIWQNGLDFDLSYRYETDAYGAFTFSMNGNQILRFSQKPNSVTGIVQDVNGCKNGARYCTSEYNGSFRLNWRMDAYTASVTFNYTRPYNAPSNTFPWSLPGPNKVANFQHVGSLQTFDLNLGYTLPEEWLEGTNISFSITNVLDMDPPWFNNASGSTNGSEIGRLMSLALVKKW